MNNIFKATTNDLTKALCEVWDDWDPENEPNFLILPNGRCFIWESYYAHNLCAKGRVSEEHYSSHFEVIYSLN